ncbi:ABC transporter permease [Fulvivirgaceae bacterium BMA12]|uniref:ABC transporter permease n=1 Tax=Agaribacillus aureus TaxID=3051825 RepID=A0ABT8L8X3_9BACT|nr:ABC transporter permease [Fulvivirgaceae bacterium BMA12]
MKANPPKTALKFLRWFCREDYLEEIEGDLIELYEDYYQWSPRKASWKFTWSVIRYFRPTFIKPFNRYPSNNIAMFRHNFLLSFRSFKRYRNAFFINLIGLSSALACVLLIYLWVNDELHVDKFHEKDHRLFQVMEHLQYDEVIRTTKETSGPMAEAIMEEMPEVAYAAAVAPPHWPGFDGFILSVGEKNVEATGQYVGKDYFNIFSYDLIHGSADQVLTHKNAIVISEALAIKLFNTTEGIMGKEIVFQHEQPFLVSGVFKSVPINSSTQFDFVMSFELYKDIKFWVDDWGSLGPHVYVVLKAGTDVSLFNEKFAGLIKRRFPESIRSPFLKRYSDNYLFSAYENGVLVGGRIEYVRLFSIVAGFILLIACVNFMSLSTAQASRRSKEIGIKKVVGSRRKDLILQYLSESVLMAFFSMIMAFMLVALFLPQFSEIVEKQLSLTYDHALLFSALVITLFTGLAAGSYPAFYLSGLKPVSTLKGKLNAGSNAGWIRKGLVVFQFTISVILMVSVWVVYRQITFVQEQNIGYNKDNIIFFDVEGNIMDNMETFLTEVRRLPGVVNASGTGHRMIGHNWSVSGIQWEGRAPDDMTRFEVAAVNYDLIETLGIEIKEGRSFSKEFSAESAKIIFNEASIKAMQLQEPIGRIVNFMGEKEIIGIVKDFHFESLHEKVKPFCFILAPGSENKIMVKIEAGREKEALDGLRDFYESYNAGFAFDYQFLDESYQAFYAAEQRVATLSKYFAGIAILISCLGLFGLATFTAERRLKEISIRKILGAGESGIVRLLSRDFTGMVLVAIAIATPLSYFIATTWLENFAYRIDLKWWYFIGVASLTLLIAWLTVGLQTLKAARISPTECLKNE